MEEEVKGLVTDADNYRKVGLAAEAKMKLLRADSIKPHDSKIKIMLKSLK